MLRIILQVIKGNFVLIYELLDEVLDHGYPQVGAVPAVKRYHLDCTAASGCRAFICPGVGAVCRSFMGRAAARQGQVLGTAALCTSRLPCCRHAGGRPPCSSDTSRASSCAARFAQGRMLQAIQVPCHIVRHPMLCAAVIPCRSPTRQS